MKLTEWYPASVKPVREGLYEVRFMIGDRRRWRRWNGLFWMRMSSNRMYAMTNIIAGSVPAEWRGLAEPPKC